MRDLFMALVSTRHIDTPTDAHCLVAWWRVRMLATIPFTIPPSRSTHHSSEIAVGMANRDQRCFHVSTLILSNRRTHENLDVQAYDPLQLDERTDATVDEDAMFVAQLLLGTH